MQQNRQNMKGTTHVCKIEQAMRLKQLGVNQQSLFYWMPYLHNGRRHLVFSENIPEINADYISAFTAQELLDHLPATIKDKDHYSLRIIRGEMRYIVSYEKNREQKNESSHNQNSFYYSYRSDDNLAVALALMLEFLIENGIVKTKVSGVLKDA